jgi:Transposase, Mutator family
VSLPGSRFRWRLVATLADGARARGSPGAVGIFPGRDAIIRLVGAVLAEQNDEWTESRATWDWKSSRLAGKPPSSIWETITLGG